MSDLMREEFESWAMTNAFLGLSESCMGRHKEGYLSCELHAAWEAWQASRECLVIDLDPDESADDGATYLHQDFVKDRIQSFGLKVKP